jgi:hypothetical protein
MKRIVSITLSKREQHHGRIRSRTHCDVAVALADESDESACGSKVNP